jgi:cation diffusion facilitator family transporter
MSSREDRDFHRAGGAEDNREKMIIRTSTVGIGANVLLAVFKAIVGTISNSIAITLDAVNNLSDAISSIVTIVGTKLAGKLPDRKHPLGYGRIEYLSAMIIAFIVLYAGVESLIESIKKIITPATPDYSGVTLLVVAAAIVVKIFLGFFFKKKGNDANSDSLKNSGQDAMLDAVLSGSTLAAAIIYIFSGISLEAILGVIISVIILKSGIEMFLDTVSEMIGERYDADSTKRIKKDIQSVEGVHGVYDLVLNNYGPDKWVGSVHIAVPDTYTADQIDRLCRRVTSTIYKKDKVLLTGIGIYSLNTKSEEIAAEEKKVHKVVMAHKGVISMHAFYFCKEDRQMRFDIVLSFDDPDRLGTYYAIHDEVQKMYPDMELVIAMDQDISD